MSYENSMLVTIMAAATADGSIPSILAFEGEMEEERTLDDDLSPRAMGVVYYRVQGLVTSSSASLLGKQATMVVFRSRLACIT